MFFRAFPACLVAAGLILPASAAGNAVQSRPLTPVYRASPRFPYNKSLIRRQGCVGMVFSVSRTGRVANIRVLSAYPRWGFVKPSRDAIAQWRFLPPLIDGKPVPTPRVRQIFIFQVHANPNILGSHLHANSREIEKQVHDTLSWMCAQPLFLVRPIPILAAHPASRAAPRPPAPSTAPAILTYLPAASINPAVILARRLLPEPQSTTVTARFCIDPKGRLANVVLRGARSTARAASALAALDALDFSARTIDKIPVWTCGLTTRMRFFAPPRHGRIGAIERTRFTVLSGTPPTPPLRAAKPPRIALSIPPRLLGHLPPVARIEVEFCIRPDGTVTSAHVVHAEPAQIFNRAALETVRGWRFAAPGVEMCNIYQSVAFKIPKVRT